MNIFDKTLYSLSTWRANPTELTHRAIHSDNPELFGVQRHRFNEAILFFSRLGLRPINTAFLKHVYRKTGYEPVGFGYYTTALRKLNDVIKIYEFTTKNSEIERINLVNSLNIRLKIAKKYLGKYMAETEVIIENHPILDKKCVIIHQPFIEGRLLHKKPYSKHLEPKNVPNYTNLLKIAKKMFDDTGYLLDVNGKNMTETADGVVVLDTIIMGEVDVKMRSITLKTLLKELDSLNL